ncbi:hypothetical protein [Clostridium sp.]|uniref:hypothetical protein n=1 Tax=Clostridium sp. TaxID=1506 RepID=UPI002603476F|nr:hypothetical protein [Clostridium sp.]
MVTIYRFSEDGFVPKYQNKIIDKVKYWRNFKIDKTIQDWQIESFNTAINKAKSIKINDIKNAVFAFVNKPSIGESRLLLNHLSKEQKCKRKWYKAEIDETAIVYADTDIVGKVEHLDKFILSELLGQYPYYSAVIIPKESIKLIRNIEIINQGRYEIWQDTNQ